MRLQRTRLDPRLAVEHRRNRRQNFRAAAMILLQLVDLRAARPQFVAVFGEHFRIGITKTVDRLVDIADAEEAGPQQVHQAPLQAIGVLQFVHQHMLEPSRDLHLDRFVRFEQRDGKLLQIREIHCGLLTLFRAIGCFDPRNRGA